MKPYSLRKTKNYIAITTDYYEKENITLFHLLENVLKKRCSLTATQNRDTDRIIQLLQIITRYGKISTFFSSILTVSYAKDNDVILCIFADFISLNNDPQFRNILKVDISRFNAFLQNMCGIIMIAINKKIERKNIQSIRGVIDSEDHCFHFLMLHEIFHYLQSDYHLDSSKIDSARLALSLPQEYMASKWAVCELKTFLDYEKQIFAEGEGAWFNLMHKLT